MHNELVYNEATRRNNTREKVRDGYFNDLPESLKTKIMDIHKLIKKTVDEVLENDHYEDLKDSRWAMSCIDDFCQMPKDKAEIGSVRVYKVRNTYKAMIQATGHFRNHEYGWIEELLHDFIGNVYTTIRPIIRKKYDFTITNEGRGGEPFEGFDIYPPAKVAKELWESFADRKTKTIMENGDLVIDNDPNIENEEEFVPLFGIAKRYDRNEYYPDGTKKTGTDLSSLKFANTFDKLTMKDQYSHAVVSFNEDLTDMYSYEASGFTEDSIENGKWDYTDSIYICVMFVKKSDKEKMRREVERLTKVKDKTRYAYSNFVRGVLGQYRHYDTRFFCSAFSTYILQCDNLKNIHRDYSVQRPEDITILPRAFYVTNVKNKEDFQKRRSEIHTKVQRIYRDHISEIREYNSQLPKLMFQQKVSKLKTFDKIIDWFMRDVIGGNYA